MALTPKVVFQTPWFSIATVDPGESESASEPYYRLERPDGIIAMVFDEIGRIVLVDQYRPPLGRHTLEMPAGGLEAGETPETAVAREIFEETGFVCEKVMQMAPCRLMLNRENVIEYFYICLRARPSAGFKAKERIEIRPTPRHELLSLVTSRRFDQTAALGGMYIAERIYGVDLLRDDVGVIESKLTVGR